MRTKYHIKPNEIEKGSKAFRRHEKRDAMYKVATFLIDNFWGKPQEMADALGVLLLTWNNALYRYGMFDFTKLEQILARRMNKLEVFRKRDILTFSNADAKTIKTLFNEFLDALKIAERQI